MDFIESCTKDLEKILGFKVTIFNERTKILSLKDLVYLNKSGSRNEYSFSVKKTCECGSQTHETVSVFSLIQMPGCCGICISTGSHVAKVYRGKGVATRLNAFRKDIAKHLGYTVLMCTDVAHNEPQNKVLAKNSWKSVHSFKNKRTKNTVNISVVDLDE